MKGYVIAAAALLSLTGTAAAEVKTASTPINPALAIALPDPADNRSVVKVTYTRAAAVGTSVPSAADPARATVGAATAPAGSGPARKSAYTGKPDISISCVPGELKALISEIERRWGDVLIVSAYRKGATVRGTGRPSKHASCQAVDFKPAPGTYRAVARWLKETHNGGIGTYSGHFHHIHIDAGPKVTWHN